MKKILDMIEKYSLAVIIILFSVMVFSIFLQVVLRYVFNMGNSWAEELARYSFVWLVLLGAAVAVRRGRHMRIDFFINLFPLRVKRVIETMLNFSLALFLIVLTYYGVRLVLLAHRQLSTGLSLPMSYAYASIPVGGILMLIFLFEPLIADLKANRVVLKEDD